jgi:hypothetical protein
MKHLLLALLVSAPVFAHDDHDWRLDHEAFLGATVEIPYSTQASEKSKFFRSSRIDTGFLKEKLQIFASVNRQKQEDLDISRKFLADEYEKLGFEVSLHAFGSGTNFVAEKKGTKNPNKVLILSSHIDSVGNKGANDNGTGTIGLLTVAKVLAQKNYDYTIRILGFDREEVGLKGSDAYVAALPNKSDIIGNINFEMMGYHSKNDGGFHLIDCDSNWTSGGPRKYSEFLSNAVKASIGQLSLGLTVVKTCTTRSDHASFWRHKIPAVVISENFFGGDGDPCYHKSCDVADSRLNYSYMQKILDAVLDATEKLLNSSK